MNIDTNRVNAIGFVVLGLIGLGAVFRGVPPGAAEVLTGITGGIVGCINGAASSGRKDSNNPPQP